MSTPGKGANRFGRQKIDYRGKMILAPMVKIGTLPFRLLCLSYGADLVYTEEIIDWRILRSERRENEALDTVDYVDKTDDTLVLRVSPQERGKLVLQIGTSDPDRAVRVAKMVEQDVDAIDVNMGCPKGFSLKGGMGAALLTHPDKVRMILTSLVAAVEIPVTCKIRILPSMEDTLALVKVIEATGVSAFAVHGRTKDERPNHEVHMDSIQKVVEACITSLSTVWGGNLLKWFCNLFSESSSCLLGQNGCSSTAKWPLELQENILKNLFNKLPPQSVVSTSSLYRL